MYINYKVQGGIEYAMVVPPFARVLASVKGISSTLVASLIRNETFLRAENVAYSSMIWRRISSFKYLLNTRPQR